MYLTETKAYNVPISVVILYKVAVTYALNDKGSFYVVIYANKEENLS